jgi:hypothetical protein
MRLADRGAYWLVTAEIAGKATASYLRIAKRDYIRYMSELNVYANSDVLVTMRV